MITFTRTAKDAYKALQMLKKNGFAYLIEYNAGTKEFDPVSGNFVTTDDLYDITAFIGQYDRKQISEAIRSTDRKCIFCGRDIQVKPQINHTVIYNEEKYIVVNVEYSNINDTYTVQLRVT